jgi:RNA polymerase sigma factor (TIGR02999 family)
VNYAYVVGMWWDAELAMSRNGLQIIDVSDPDKPWLAGTYDWRGGGWVHCVKVEGAFAYVTRSWPDPEVGERSGLAVIEISDPANPRQVGFYEINGVATSVALSGHCAYLAGPDGLHVIDVLDPAHPRRLGGNSAFGASDVVVHGDKVFVAAGEHGLIILNSLTTLRFGFGDNGRALYWDLGTLQYASIGGRPLDRSPCLPARSTLSPIGEKGFFRVKVSSAAAQNGGRGLTNGQPESGDGAIPLARLAHLKMAQEKPGQTLQPTALVHEAWLRLTQTQACTWANRRHFFGAAAEAMRRILVERARAKGRQRRGGGCRRVNIEEVDIAAESDDETVLLVDEALEKLNRLDPIAAELIRLRFFVGLPNDQAAELLGLSDRTARRNWAYARAWLATELEDLTADRPGCPLTASSPPQAD